MEHNHTPEEERRIRDAALDHTIEDTFPASDPTTEQAPGGSPEPVHTLNGTMVTDRALLAILENFQGDVPDALREYGAPERVER